uniref:Solute carrier family 28 member 3 n=1 Tax=Schistocephalus solidus TaxID=70667 RepID=A0A0X3NJU0_SCHSO
MSKEYKNSVISISTIVSKDSAESGESSDVGTNVFDIGKPMTEWNGDDFPRKKVTKAKGINRILQAYADGRSKIFGHKKHQNRDENEATGEDGEEEPKYDIVDRDEVCCDGIAGICGLIFLLLIDVAYVAYATYCNHLATEDDIRLVWLSVLVWVVILCKVYRRLARLGRRRGGCFTPFDSCRTALQRGWKGFLHLCKAPWNACWSRASGSEKSIKKKKHLVIKIIATTLMLIFVVLCLIFFVILKDLRNLVSISGIVLLILISIAISWHPGKINWQPALVGIFIQLLFAVLTLQTRPGFIVFDFLGARMAEFLENSMAGSTFVFADYHCFAFDVLPVVVFFSSFISIMFHLGIISILIEKPSIVAQKIMGTTGPETLNAVANIFVSMTESPLITRPYMHMMTNSELHAIIVNGFASVAGSVLAAYIGFGVPANHLLIACVMSAPAALAVSKIIYPETRIAPLASLTRVDSIKSPYSNVLEAAMVGAMESVPIVAGIASNLIAFLSIYNFFNRTLTWLGKRACMTQDLTFELVFSYILWPIAFTMGVPEVDCFKVAELIGVKSMLNEFVAFTRLGIIIQDSAFYRTISANSTTTYLPNSTMIVTLNNGTAYTLEYGVMQTKRAEVISTYALCGFANIGSIGIMLGAMVTLIPQRRKELSEMILGGMVGGTIACFLTGCFAGLLYDES